MNGASRDVVELNIGGVAYTTHLHTLRSQKGSYLAKIFGVEDCEVPKDSKGRHFIDRDGVLFRYILDYLRNDMLILPENFHEVERLKVEAEFYGLTSLIDTLSQRLPAVKKAPIATSSKERTHSRSRKEQTSRKADKEDRITSTCGPSCIIVGYRGTFAFGRDGMADVKFRKLSRILINGRVATCREVFGDTLNESRDPDRGPADRYTCRFFLKHQFVEQAFEALMQAGFTLEGSCGSGTNSSGDAAKAGQDTDENRWQHYNEFVWLRY